MKQAWVVVTLVAALCARAQATEQHAWVKTVPDEKTWKAYSKTVASDELGKCVIDVKTGEIYFFDVNLFNIHADFVLGVLLKQAWTYENVKTYNQNYERVKPKFILGYLTHHLKVDKWTFSFWEGDKIGADDVMRVHKKLDETFWKKGMPFRPDSPMQEKVALEVQKRGLKTITNNEIYKAADYQAFTKGAAVGKLRVVPIGMAFEKLSFDRHDIVLLQESYPDITPVAGILATQFSTPLSHVNLRAGAWGIPNAGDKKAREKYGNLDGKYVYYEVSETHMTLREASPAEVDDMKRKVAEAKHVKLPSANLDNRRFAMLTRMRAKDVTSYGTKASNLGEIVTANLEGMRVPSGFGVPFYYYAQHLKQNGLDKRIDAMLADPKWPDATWRKAALDEMRKAIMDAPIDEATLDMIYKRVRISLGGKGVFVRSSSNSEDLPGFNGAGLYDTVGNVVGKKQLGEALRFVWASIWNLRAVDEREAFGIDHKTVYMGVLVQIGVNATAAGVLVTKNLWDTTDENGFTINAKWGLGERVVQGQKSPEQVIFDPTNDGTKIIARSDDPIRLVFDENGGTKEIPVDPNAGVILSEERAKKLCTMVQKFIPLFTHGHPLDVEWVLEGEGFWIVQARPYVGAGS